MSEPTMILMFFPARVDLMMLGFCSFQLVQNIRLKEKQECEGTGPSASNSEKRKYTIPSQRLCVRMKM